MLSIVNEITIGDKNLPDLSCLQILYFIVSKTMLLLSTSEQNCLPFLNINHHRIPQYSPVSHLLSANTTLKSLPTHSMQNTTWFLQTFCSHFADFYLGFIFCFIIYGQAFTQAWQEVLPEEYN